jgi:hypothetical protein
MMFFYPLGQAGLMSPPGAAGIDPYLAQTKLLLLGNGSGGSTSFPDSSPSARTITAYGNAQVDATTKKYGSGSITLDGTGDYLDTPNSADFDFGSGDFTLEAWVYINAGSGTARPILTNRPSGGSANGFMFYLSSTERCSFQCWDAGGASICNLVSSGSNLPNATWQHFAATRQGSDIRIFQDGAHVGTASSATAIGASVSPLLIGTDVGFGLTHWNGRFDDIRVTKGVARYTAGYTPPTAELPTT